MRTVWGADSVFIKEMEGQRILYSPGDGEHGGQNFIVRPIEKVKEVLEFCVKNVVSGMAGDPPVNGSGLSLALSHSGARIQGKITDLEVTVEKFDILEADERPYLITLTEWFGADHRDRVGWMSRDEAEGLLKLL